MEEFTVRTAKRTDLIDITDKVEIAVEKSRIKEGVCLVFVPHATAAIIMNEYEPNLKSDFLNFFERFIPKGNYAHNRIDDNAEAHLKSAFLGQGKTLPISGGKLVRGTWQQIMLCEFDGPRERRIIVSCK